MAAKNPLKTDESSPNDTIFLNCLAHVLRTSGGVAAAMLVGKNELDKKMSDWRNIFLIQRNHWGCLFQ